MSNALSKYLDRRDAVYKTYPISNQNQISHQNNNDKEKLQVRKIDNPSYPANGAPVIINHDKEIKYSQVDRYEAEERAKDKMYRRGYYRDDYDGGNG